MAMDVGSSGGKKKGRSRPEMNVTPLVDVVLVLLIIFMVVAPLMAQQLFITLPDRDPAEPPPDQQGPIVVSVGSDGVAHINRDRVTDTELPVRLRGVLAARRTRAIFFDAHDDAPYGRAVEVLDLARGAGARQIAVATEALSGID